MVSLGLIMAAGSTSAGYEIATGMENKARRMYCGAKAEKGGETMLPGPRGWWYLCYNGLELGSYIYGASANFGICTGLASAFS